ncbi:hypothetical protein BH11ACT6_BH11ACT6_50740 [soil metagenome]
MYAVDLNSGASLEYRSDDRFAMCSTFKTYAAARVLQLAEQGLRRLDTPIPIETSDIVENSPITSANVGHSLPLEEVCAAALTKSDNTAGNLLLRCIGGPPEITTFARSVGDDQSRLDRWETELNTALPGDPRDTTTPRALAAGYRQVLTGAALSDSSRERLLAWMAANATSQKRFRAGLPAGWTSADKTGAGDFGSTNDAGLLIGPAGQTDHRGRPHALPRRRSRRPAVQRCNRRHGATHRRQIQSTVSDCASRSSVTFLPPVWPGAIPSRSAVIESELAIRNGRIR